MPDRPLLHPGGAIEHMRPALAHRAPDLGQELLAELLRSGHHVSVTACGNSMLPTIANGEQVWIEPLLTAGPRRGDIVYLRRPDSSHVLHRVVRVFADGRLQTRGDAHRQLDDTVEPQAVLGKLQSSARRRQHLFGALLMRIRHWGRRSPNQFHGVTDPGSGNRSLTNDRLRLLRTRA